MSNDNNIPRLLPCGLPNIQNNPKVLAAFLDLLGTNLTHTMNDIRDLNMVDGQSPSLQDGIPKMISNDQIQVLIQIQHTLYMLRKSVGIGTDWYNTNTFLEVEECKREKQKMDQDHIAAVVEIANSYGIPVPQSVKEMIELNKQPTLSDAADAILNNLRSDGIIG